MRCFSRGLSFASVAGLAGVAVLSAPALASSVLKFEFDVNSITIQATDAQGNASAFGGVNHTGNLVFSNDADSTLAIGINGASQPSFNASFLCMNGHISYVNGVSTGGSMNIKVLNPDSSTDTYSFLVAPGDPVARPLGAISFSLLGYQFDSNTLQGNFSDANYGGVDVSPWFNAQPQVGLAGAFFQLKYAPDERGFSDQSDVDIDVNTPVGVPLPSTAAAGCALIGVLALGQRRRRALATA